MVEKTNWMVMYDMWAADGSKDVLRYELNAINERITFFNENTTGYDAEVELLLSKYDYILGLIGNYSEIKFYMNGDDSGTLYTREFETEEHHDRWKKAMEGHIEIFSEKIL